MLRFGRVPVSCLVVVTGLLAWSVPLDAQPAPGGRLSRAPYLQLSTPESMTVVWRTAGAIRPVVRFGLTPDRLDQFDPAVRHATTPR